MAREIIVLGGTFDPVHHGHLIVARAVAEAKGVDKVVLIPAACPPHKAPAQADADDRLAMLRLAVAEDPTFEVCDLELRRSGRSYTYQTLRQLHEVHGQDARLHWIVGADMLADLPKWRRIDEVLATAELLVVARPPWPAKVQTVLDGLRGRLENGQIERLRRSVVAVPRIELSSSEIRRRVAAGRSIRFLVPEAVRVYIRDHALYP